MTAEPAVQSDADKAARRYAMLSVYYGSLGRQLAASGAPAVLLPLEARPLPLEDALAEIERRWPEGLPAAVWTVIRSVPPARRVQPGGGTDARTSVERRYPAVLRQLLADHDPPLEELDRKRAEYRADANLFAASLVARAEGRNTEADALRRELDARTLAFSGPAAHVLGMTPSDFLAGLNDHETEQVRKLEDEVGMGLYEFVGEFADAAAFVQWWQAPAETDEMTVYPATSVIRQDASTLVTTITVTALVRCDNFKTLARAMDPQCWSHASEVIEGSRYVRGPYDLRDPEEKAQDGEGIEDGKARMLEENVRVCWGIDEESVGCFHNVLRIGKFHVDESVPTISLDYSLARSIDSRILWDARGGGLLVDQGFIRARVLTRDRKRWRVTSRKTVLFSDRSPNASAPGWLDFGQMLNYLAPAALSWWLESELYSAADPDYSKSNGSG